MDIPPGLLATADQECADLQERLDNILRGWKVVMQTDFVQNEIRSTTEQIAILSGSISSAADMVGPKSLIIPLLAVAILRLAQYEEGTS